MQIKTSRDEKVKLMAQGLYSKSKTTKSTHFVTKRPTDPVYPKPKEVIGMGQALVIGYECVGCGRRNLETSKKCLNCGEVNEGWLHNTFGGRKKKMDCSELQ